MTQAGPSGGRAGRPQQTPWRGVRLHVVSGKGGAGKTTLSAALAIALATGGKRVLLVEVEERQGLAEVLDTKPLTYEERCIATAPGGGEVFGLAVDPHEALMEYLALYYHMRRAGKTLERIGAVDFATTVAPGLRDVLLTGKVFEAVRRVDHNDDFVYDSVVVDAPPTGRISRFLGVTTDVAGLAKVGPIHRQAQSINRLFRSQRTVVHLVTLLEEMSVQETAEGAYTLDQEQFHVGAVLVNATQIPALRIRELTAIREGEIDTAAVEAELREAGVSDPDTARTLLAEGADYAERMALERRARRLLRRLGKPTFELPILKGGIDVEAVHWLANELRTKGAV